MALATQLVTAADRLFGTPDSRRLVMARLSAAATASGAQRDLQNLLLAYAHNISLYDWMAENRYESGIRDESMKGIRTPASRIVDFYVSHLWPGDLEDAFPIETENPSILEPIEAIWEWSNWTAQKDVAAAWYATYGDLFARIETPDDESVRFKLIQPQHVSDFEDQYGHLKYLRLDIPQDRERNGITEWFTRVEVWSKADQSYRVWEHMQGLDAPLDDLGEPDEEITFAEMGIDFIPFVRAPFRDVGEQWGMGCFTHLLDKMDELNRKATRHAELMFLNINAIWQAVSSNPTGQPAPPIAAEEAGVITVGDQRFFGMPAGWRLEDRVPKLDYDAYLATIESEEKALAADAPEMLWSRLSETNDLSGRALAYLLAPAVKRVERARGQAERALIRLAMMGLSIGQGMGIFPSLQGTYDEGSFQHTFKKRDVLPKDLLDEATTLEKRMTAVIKREEWLKAASPFVMEEEGLTEEEIARIEEERQTLAEEAAEQLVTAMSRGAPAPAAPRRSVRRVERDGEGRIARVIDEDE
jgi:hypothetical protein